MNESKLKLQDIYNSNLGALDSYYSPKGIN